MRPRSIKDPKTGEEIILPDSIQLYASWIPLFPLLWLFAGEGTWYYTDSGNIKETILRLLDFAKDLTERKEWIRKINNVEDIATMRIGGPGLLRSLVSFRLNVYRDDDAWEKVVAAERKKALRKLAEGVW